MESIKSQEIKKILFEMGADLCGIATVDRFADAPEGFHPYDVLPSCKSAVVFAKAFPTGTLFCSNNMPYTITRNMLSNELDAMSTKFCALMEKSGITAVPTGTISHTRLDQKTGRRRAMVSAKHSAVAAGLGRIGKNTLLITPEYGNMVWLNVVLTDYIFEPDDLLQGNPCSDNCTICIDSCPVKALGDPEMDQGACYAFAFRAIEGEDFSIKCHSCRFLCPNCFGSKNRSI